MVLQAAAVAPPGAVRVDRDSIAAAMRLEQGYNRHVTTNQSRLQTRVLLRLARSARLAHPEGLVLFIDFEDWFQAYLSALELRADQAPLSVRLTHEHQYDILVDAQAGTVVQRVKQGPPPRLALTVVWRSRTGPDGYSYRDTLSRPVVEMTYQRTVSYRLLDFGDEVVQDQFGGISGRPATGALSLLFRLIGQGRPVWSRSAVATDGWQVIVGKGRKGLFVRTITVTLRPDGLAEPGVPAERSDLKALEHQLRQSIDLVYHPWTRALTLFAAPNPKQ